MTDEEVIELVTSEFQNPQFGDTKRLLAIHEPESKDGKIFIDRIDREKKGVVIVYTPVKEEFFYFAVYINTEEKTVSKVKTEPGNQVYLRVTSKTLSLNELLAFTNLQPTSSWNNGDYREGRKSKYDFSSIIIEINPEPDEFEDKLKKLLKHLSQDKKGIHSLVQNATTYIAITKEYHAGSIFLGRINIDTESIAMLHEMNLEIELDITSWGNPFEEQPYY